MSFLEYMKKQPRITKTYYAFFGAFFITGMIGVIWALSLPARFASSDIAPESHTATAQSEEGGFTDLFDTAKGQLGLLIESFKTETEEEQAEKGSTDLQAELPSNLSSLHAEDPTAHGEETSTTSHATLPLNDDTATKTPELLQEQPAGKVIQIATTSKKTHEQEGE